MLETILDGLRKGRNRRTIIHECGRCGTTLDCVTDACPHCEDARVVTFEF